MSISTDLASRVVAFRYENLNGPAIFAAKNALLDTLGVALAGSGEPATKIVGDVLSSGARHGISLVFGGERRINCLDAALINGTAAHALDFDDYSRTLGGHPSAPILPALLALAEEVDAGGRDVLLAYIVGIETVARLAEAVNFYHYEKGWHPTATLGIFGAASACSRLLNSSEDQVATALSISVSLSSGIKANFGTMTKPLHVGQCSRNGLFAAMLARDGFTANLDAFEHKQGFLNVFNGPGNFDTSKFLERWANPLEVVEPGLTIKQYPCCASTHPALDAMIEIARAHPLRPEAVLKIAACIHERGLAHTNRPNPKSALEAKFSLQYCLARALMHGKVVLEHFGGEAFLDSDVRSLMKKIQVAPCTSARTDVLNPFGAEVEVVKSDGQVYSAKVEAAMGLSPENPLSPELLKAKFEGCAGKILPTERVSKLYKSIQLIEELPSIRELTANIEARTLVGG